MPLASLAACCIGTIVTVEVMGLAVRFRGIGNSTLGCLECGAGTICSTERGGLFCCRVGARPSVTAGIVLRVKQ